MVKTGRWQRLAEQLGVDAEDVQDVVRNSYIAVSEEEWGSSHFIRLGIVEAVSKSGTVKVWRDAFSPEITHCLGWKTTVYTIPKEYNPAVWRLIQEIKRAKNERREKLHLWFAARRKHRDADPELHTENSNCKCPEMVSMERDCEAPFLGATEVFNSLERTT